MNSHAQKVKILETSHSDKARLGSVPLNRVRLTDRFWQPRQELNRTTTLPSQFEQLENTRRLDHFRRAAGQLSGPFVGRLYDDSDVYKWLEAACWTIAAGPDPELAERIGYLVELIGDAQAPDGYLNTYYVLENESERWRNLRDGHELYCAGHLIQAAVAHTRVTGDNQLLSIARRFADHIVARFGSSPELKRATGGHPEIEMALVELYRTTSHTPYLNMAAQLLDARGQGAIGGQAYHQDRLPFRDLDRLEGHAVRAVYLAAGAADIYAEKGDTQLLETLERLWTHLTQRQMYISGGIGARAASEALGKDYELPDVCSYAESCAAIGNLMWARRMLMLNGDARYADLIERIMYNGALVGISQDGRNYFYRNPLADSGESRRLEWYSTACCPPNLARFLSTVPDLLFGISDEGLWIHQYAACVADIELSNGKPALFTMETDYPWSGEIHLEMRTGGEFSVFLRIPAWCRTGASRLEVNRTPIEPVAQPGSYVRVSRHWEVGDEILLRLDMAVEKIRAHPAVEDYRGKIALMRGPLLYCFEQVDHPQLNSSSIQLSAGTKLDVHFDDQLLGGLVTLKGMGERSPTDPAWSRALYMTEEQTLGGNATQPVELTAIPYFAWANRTPGWMKVWIPQTAT